MQICIRIHSWIVTGNETYYVCVWSKDILHIRKKNIVRLVHRMKICMRYVWIANFVCTKHCTRMSEIFGFCIIDMKILSGTLMGERPPNARARINYCILILCRRSSHGAVVVGNKFRISLMNYASECTQLKFVGFQCRGGIWYIHMYIWQWYV